MAQQDGQAGLHSHCEVCMAAPYFLVKQTSNIKQPKLVRCNEDAGCKFIICEKVNDRGCGAAFHGCKLAEHELLCPEALVPCINEGNGCKRKMRRRELGIHLEKCPASVINCFSEWNRRPMWYHLSVHGHSNQGLTSPHLPFYCGDLKDIKEDLDVALALRDQQVLNESRENKLRRLKRVLRDPINRKHPALPLLASAAPRPVLAAASSQSHSPSPSRDEDHTAQTLTDSEDSSESYAAPGLIRSVCRQLTKNCTVQEGAGDVAAKKPPPPPPSMPPCHGDLRLSLDLRFERYSQTAMKPKHMYTFMCGQDFRRDEFAHHCKDFHADIQGGLDGWIERRCPLAYLGCSFKVRRMEPVGGKTVVFNPCSRSFAVACKDPHVGDPTVCLERLDLTALMAVFTKLDSASLANLALTCPRMRDVMSLELPSRGMVAPRWKKIEEDGGRIRWVIQEYVWRFSAGFDPIKDWVFEDNQSEIAKHLAICPFYVKSPLPYGKEGPPVRFLDGAGKNPKNGTL